MENISGKISGGERVELPGAGKKHKNSDDFLKLIRDSKSDKSPLQMQQKGAGQSSDSNNILMEPHDEAEIKIQNSVTQGEGNYLKSEVYEQCLFSIGKLSYLDKNLTGKFVGSNSGTGNYVAVQTQDMHSVSAVNRGGDSHERLLKEILPVSRIVKNGAWSKKDELTNSAVVSSSIMSQELEKKKISLMKESQSAVLVVRDYFTKHEDVLTYINDFQGVIAMKIKKLIMNGKVVK